MKAKLLILALLLSIGTLQAKPLTIGSIQGKKITLESLSDPQIYKLHLQLYDAAYQRFALESLEQLGKKYPRFQIPSEFPVSEEEIKEVYDANKNQINKKLSEVRTQLIAYLQSKKRILKIDQLFSLAKKEGFVRFTMAEPESPKMMISVKTAFFLSGDPKKKGVMLLEFSDYHCPFCKRVQATFSSIRKEHKEFQFAFRHFPLTMHRNAEKAALAVECARGDRNGKEKVVKMHLAMFQNPQISTLEGFTKLAKQQGIATPRFKKCFSKGKHIKKIKEDMKQASAIGIQGTPSFVIGIYNPQTQMLQGELFSGALPKKQIVKVLQSYQSKL